MNTKICKVCGQEFSGLRKSCNRCRISEWRYRTKQRLVEYRGGKCLVCNYKRNLSSLDFHHIDPSKKDFGISRYSRGIEDLKKEVDKCALLCSNCHAEVHSSDTIYVTGDKRRMFELYQRINSLSNRTVFAISVFRFTEKYGYNIHWETMSDEMSIHFLPHLEEDARISSILEDFKDLSYRE